LLNNLSEDVKNHWNNLPRWPRERRRNQLTEWLHEASQPKWGPQDLEKFFLSDKLSQDEKQRLLEMPRAKMDAELERLYLKSELNIEFSDALRGQRGRFGDRPPEGGRPGENWRGEGPPPRGERFGPERRPGERFDRDRPPRPDGPRGMGPDEGPPGRRRPPGNGFSPDGPPDGPPPRREGEPPPPPPDGKVPV
jgi:hypothetical protein